MPYKLITPPSEYPVLRDELAKVHIKVDGTDEDALLDTYIGAAVELVEDCIQRQLMQATWELQLTCWDVDCNGYIRLNKAPLVSITSVKYDPADGGSEVAINPAEYQVDTTSVPGRIRFIGNLPSVADKPNAIRIRFKAGYGADAADAAAQRTAVPSRAKTGILRAVGDFYAFRQDEQSGQYTSKLSNSIENFLNPLRLFL